MEKKKMYRSAHRSQKLIKTAYLKLLHQKEMQKITVTDIIQQAQISRSTFYAHFSDVTVLYQEIEKELSCVVMKIVDTFHSRELLHSPRPLYLKIAERLERDEEFSKCVIRANSAFQLFDKCKKYTYHIILSDKERWEQIEDKKEAILKLNYHLYGCFGLVVDWANNRTGMTLTELARFISDNIEQHISSCLEPASRR